MPITRSYVYKATDGSKHPTLAKAIQRSEDAVAEFIESAMKSDKGFSEHKHEEITKLIQHVLDNRGKLRELLNFFSETDQFQWEDDNAI